MPGQILAVPGTNTLYAIRQATLFDEDKTTLSRLDYPNGNRGPTTMDQGWTHRGGWWPSRGGMGFYTDPAAGQIAIFSQDMGSDTPGEYEPWRRGNQGCNTLKYIMGQCKDANNAVVSGATVQGFLTATDAFVRETQADANGNYELGTEYPGQNHYLVAYRAGAPDAAGTTVNTLQGTNRDGT